jgi:hypothetical protein
VKPAGWIRGREDREDESREMERVTVRWGTGENPEETYTGARKSHSAAKVLPASDSAF